MNDFKTYSSNKNLKQIINPEETKETFLKRIKELDSAEQELLLKLYDEITKEMKL